MRRAPLPAAIAALVLCAPPAASAARADRDLELERTAVIVEHDYEELPAMGPNGAVGENLMDRPGYSVANQRWGDLYVRAGIVRDEPELIERGFDAFDHAFSRQRANGSFPGADQAEKYAFFIEAVAHSVLLLREVGLDSSYRRRLSHYVRRLEKSIPFVVRDWHQFRYRARLFTHRAYVMGAALTLLGELTGGGRVKRYGRRAIEMGLRQQRAGGVNPERGGFDVRYQMAGLVYAERYAVYFPRHDLASRVRGMVERGLGWMATRIDDDGWIDWRGSTRACLEISEVTGEPKTPAYESAVRGFAYWGGHTGREELVAEAEAAHAYAASGVRQCGPKQGLPPPGSTTSE